MQILKHVLNNDVIISFVIFPVKKFFYIFVMKTLLFKIFLYPLKANVFQAIKFYIFIVLCEYYFYYYILCSYYFIYSYWLMYIYYPCICIYIQKEPF